MCKMIRRYDPRRQLDALTNRGVCVLLLLMFGFLWIIWTQAIVEYDLVPDVLRHRPKPQLVTDNVPGYYETWDWKTDNFSDFSEYRSFIGRLGLNSSLQIPFDVHQFSVDTSDRIEVNRVVPDSRNLLCSLRQRKFYSRKQEQANTSVIITFYNEAPSVLLRTIVSVLRNTPEKLLGEIIIVDDGSANRLNSTFLQGFHKKIHFKRNTKREGVIASRLMAANLLAQSQYIVFLDSHCEVNVGWLEPLVERMMLNAGTVVSPVIDVIDANSFEYRRGVGSGGMRAGFDWALQFRWFAMSEEERSYRSSAWNVTKAYASPITAGGIFAVSRQWFLELGGFSNMLKTWGGESIDFSLRVWMCGGHIEIVPCSRVGHVFRSKLPYDLPFGQNQTNYMNSKFIAEFWLSHYKPLFYEHLPEARGLHVGFNLHTELGIINKLQCHSFRWYLENVYQELIISSSSYIALGQLQQAGQCANMSAESYSEPTLSVCDSRSTRWIFNRNGRITVESQSNECLQVVGNIVISRTDCDKLQNNQIWVRDKNSIVHRESGKCLDVLYYTTKRLVVNECSTRTRRTQIWHFSVDHIIDTRA